MRASSMSSPDEIKRRVAALLFAVGSIVPGTLDVSHDEFLNAHCRAVRICEFENAVASVEASRARFQFIAYQVATEGPAVEEVGEGDEAVVAAQHWQLPAAEFEGLWESLVLPRSTKRQLLRYAATSLLFSDAGVDPTLISLNRLLLLHGPPGTGKTTLCKALAHKLSLRMGRRYPSATLLEVNSHSLFSRWFSESGKLVGKLFEHVHELVADDDALVVVLVDEVESLSGARQAAMAGSEPSDTVRVVNALLTQLDALRAHPNALVLATSNITEAIDAAFVDRADLKLHIAPPGVEARYEILRSCLLELVRAGIVVVVDGGASWPRLDAGLPAGSVPTDTLPVSQSPDDDEAPEQTGSSTPTAAGDGEEDEEDDEVVGMLKPASSSSSSSSAAAAAAAREAGQSSASSPWPATARSMRSQASVTQSASAALPPFVAVQPLVRPASNQEVGKGVDGFLPWTQSKDNPPPTATGGGSGTTTRLEHGDEEAVREASSVLSALARPGVVGQMPAACALLTAAAAHACGLSGRALRKLPFTAHATETQGASCRLEPFCAALLRAVRNEAMSRKAMTHA